MFVNVVHSEFVGRFKVMVVPNIKLLAPEFRKLNTDFILKKISLIKFLSPRLFQVVSVSLAL
jgi:hypothetical protein